MLKKILTALVFGLIAMQLNICAAMIDPGQLYLGDLTYGSTIKEMKIIHGEPDAIFDGVEGYETCEYADGATITYDKFSGQIKSIIVNKYSRNWTTSGKIGVGMYYDEWLKWHAQPDLVKVGENKTVYLYFNYKSDPVIHETFRNFGLFIAFNTHGGEITQLRIYGDTDFASFEESFDSVMNEMTK